MDCAEWKVIEAGKGRKKRHKGPLKRVATACFAVFCEPFEFNNFGSEDA